MGNSKIGVDFHSRRHRAGHPDSKARDGLVWIINDTQNALLFLGRCPYHLSDDASTLQSVSPAHRCNLASGASLHASIVFARLFYNEVDSTPRCTCHVPRRDGCPRADGSLTAAPRDLTGARFRPAWSQHTGDERSIAVVA
jgi:hypothetical protein